MSDIASLCRLLLISFLYPTSDLSVTMLNGIGGDLDKAGKEWTDIGGKLVETAKVLNQVITKLKHGAAARAANPDEKQKVDERLDRAMRNVGSQDLEKKREDLKATKKKAAKSENTDYSETIKTLEEKVDSLSNEIQHIKDQATLNYPMLARAAAEEGIHALHSVMAANVSKRLDSQFDMIRSTTDKVHQINEKLARMETLDAERKADQTLDAERKADRSKDDLLTRTIASFAVMIRELQIIAVAAESVSHLESYCKTN